VRLVVLGDPIAHSLSPAIQNAALQAAGIPGRYEARRVDEDGMRDAVAELRDGALDGANVTMPHKRLAANLADRLDPAAARAGAVNTLVRVGSEAIGHNTDIEGIRAAWEASDLPGEGPVLLLGTGGAAAAALLALEDRPVSISARSPDKAAELASALRVDVSTTPWATGKEGSVVVNATPLGMNGERLPEGALQGAVGLFDMAYGALPTPSIREMHQAGYPAVDGAEMLLAQAAVSFRLWCGQEPDAGAMRAALDEIRFGSGPAT
jgi:shikimate dehydrogenase